MVATVVSSLTVSTQAAEDWAPAEGPLMSKFAGDVSPDHVLPEYPRPQMVRDDWTNLNGLWQFAVTDASAGMPEKWDRQILVPFAIESALSGVMEHVAPDQTLWYRRTLDIDAVQPGQRMLLHFGAVDWHATVHINGTVVGEHKGGYDPFTFDVTDQLTAGENEIIVEVTDPTDTGMQPHGKQVTNPHGIWYTPVTGIWQTVWLEPVPTHYIESLRITPNLDAGKVTIEARTPAAGQLRVTATGHGFEKTVTGTGAVDVPIPDAALWSPDSPNLYDLHVELLDGDTVVDDVTSYFGMRKIEVKADENGHKRLFLNNEPLFHWGMLDQGWWPDGLYTAPTDEALRFDLEMTKAWGFNTSRKHVKVEPARWFYHADKLGVLVWQDMPSIKEPSPEWDRDAHKTGTDVELPREATEQFAHELTEIVNDFYNHPSVVVWVPFNERWGQHQTAETVELLRKLDPTRVINSASGGNFHNVGDILDVHSYPNPTFPGLDDTQAVVCGEFGGLGFPVAGHTWQDEANWGYANYKTQEAVEKAYLEKVAMLPVLIGRGLAGAIYTQTTDVEIETNGLMTYDRKVNKIDLDKAKAASAELFKTPPSTQVLMPINSEWHYTTDEPAKNWTAPSFDASAWSVGKGGFGTKALNGATVGTPWDGDQIWIRRTFDLDKIPGEVHLMIYADDVGEVYINGIPAAQEERWSNVYQFLPLSPEAQASLREGPNVIAVHCKNRRRSQFVDAGLIVADPGTPGE